PQPISARIASTTIQRSTPMPRNSRAPRPRRNEPGSRSPVLPRAALKRTSRPNTLSAMAIVLLSQNYPGMVPRGTRCGWSWRDEHPAAENARDLDTDPYPSYETKRRSAWVYFQVNE